MKRFYCTECKRVKRVQNLPPLTSGSYGADGETLQPDVTLRRGVCRYHSSQKSRAISNDRATWRQSGKPRKMSRNR